jgi:multimeric flavodoxin WrbA
MIRSVFAELESAGIETELVQVGGTDIHSCTACSACFRNGDGHCVVESDPLNEWYGKMLKADGIILGSPTWFGDLTPELKCLIDRAGMLAMSSGGSLNRKVGAALSPVRRAGSLHTLASMNQFFLIGGMTIVGSSYWNMSLAMEPGDFARDEEGRTIMKNLGRNMAWLLEKIHA